MNEDANVTPGGHFLLSGRQKADRSKRQALLRRLRKLEKVLLKEVQRLETYEPNCDTSIAVAHKYTDALMAAVQHVETLRCVLHSMKSV